MIGYNLTNFLHRRTTPEPLESRKERLIKIIAKPVCYGH
jgi:hypothetical protein